MSRSITMSTVAPEGPWRIVRWSRVRSRWSRVRRRGHPPSPHGADFGPGRYPRRRPRSGGLASRRWPDRGGGAGQNRGRPEGPDRGRDGGRRCAVRRGGRSRPVGRGTCSHSQHRLLLLVRAVQQWEQRPGPAPTLFPKKFLPTFLPAADLRRFRPARPDSAPDRSPAGNHPTRTRPRTAGTCRKVADTPPGLSGTRHEPAGNLRRKVLATGRDAPPTDEQPL